MGKIIALVKEPCEAWIAKEVDNTLESMQGLVGGYIEAINIEDGLVLIVDEEGKIKGKELNFYLPGDIVVGTAMLVGEKGEEFADVPEYARKLLEGHYSSVKLLVHMTCRKVEATNEE